MDFRYLGNSGLKVSEISYGNWLTHGSQVENDQAKACVRTALDAGITTFDTADVYANTKAESVLGEALERLKTDYVDVYQAHRSEARRRWKRRWRPSPTSSGPARRSTSACPSGPRSSCRKATGWPVSCGSRSSPTSRR